MAFIAPLLSAVGEGAASAAGTVGSSLASAAGELGSLFTGGGEAAAAGAVPTAASAAAPAGMLANLGGGLQGLFGGGAEAAPGFVGPPAALAGPALTGPGFASGLVQGYLGTLGNYAAPSASTQLGGGVGQLVSQLQALQGSHGPAPALPLQPIVHPYAPMAGGAATHLLPLTSPPVPPQGPIMKMIGGLFQGF